MSKKIVILASKEGREALRDCGVLPPSAFKKFAEIDDHDSALSASDNAGNNKRLANFASSLGFYVWPHDPDYKRTSSGFGDYPLLSMLGMEQPKNNAEYLERKIAYTKLLGSTILHVILLDEFELEGKIRKPIVPVFLDPVVQWCDKLQEEIVREYSDEQTTGIEHAFILVARDPRGLQVDKKDIESFCARLNEPECGSGNERESGEPPNRAMIRTCFFLAGTLEIELGDQAFPSVLVWPQMVGRLLLRLLIGLESKPDDPIGWCTGGVRLWKASEFVLGFRSERVHSLMSEGVSRFVEELRTGESPAGPELSLRPWIPSVDCVLRTTPDWTRRDGKGRPWNIFQAEACHRETFDEDLWRKLLCPAKASPGANAHGPSEHAGDVDAERRRLAGEVHALMTSADSVGDAVSGWVGETSKQIRAHFAKGADAGVSGYWNKIVRLCLCRARCKDVLGGEGKDYESAKNHYVRKKYCIRAVVAVSVCAGLAFSRFAFAFGGGLFLSLLLCAGTFAGGFSAMVLMLYLHDKCGRRARSAFLDLCGIADNCVVARDKCAREQIKKSVEIRARMLQLAKMRHFERLVSRLRSMIHEELVAPSSELFVEDDLSEPTEVDPGSQDLKNQYDLFFKETNYRIGFDATSEADTPAVRVSFPEECEAVKTSWSALCSRHDPLLTANFPARYFVPFLRRTLKNFRDKYRPEVWRSLTEASAEELLAKFQPSALEKGKKFEIARRIRKFIADDVCYSAHVDHENKQDVDEGAEFYYAPVFDSEPWDTIKTLWGGIGVREQASRILLARTPHFAMLFTQSRVDFTVEDKRLVLRLRVDSSRKEEKDG